ncbi:MAG: HAD family hydrolase [Candidatus Avoscillospira sp.]
MNFQKVKAAIFDLDGTLLDTIADIGTGANTALCRYGLPAYPIEEYKHLVGHGIRTLFRLAVPEGTPEEVYQKALADYLAYYPEHCTIHTRYFPGVKEFLHALTEAGIRVAVISNKTETTGQKIISHYFPDVPWAFVWGNNGSRPLKPAVDAGRLACETLGLEPEEILYVGDGDTDMEFASKMGFLAAGVTWGYRSPEQLLAAGADFLSDSFPALQKTIGL